MNSDRQKILTDYISYLFTTRRTYNTIGQYIKYVTDFLERTEDVNRRGYLVYKRENADVMVRHSLMCSAICDLLSFLNIGYGRRDKTVKPLEKLDVISDKNKKQLNDFIIWLTDNNECQKYVSWDTVQVSITGGGAPIVKAREEIDAVPLEDFVDHVNKHGNMSECAYGHLACV